jgi:hypothetical protein
MSYTNINSVDIYNSSSLTGDYNIDNNNLHRICNNIPYINCRLYYKKFCVSIKKNPEELKMKVFATGLSKELVYFLDNIPDKVDILVLNDFILNERLTNLPSNLKKIVFLGYMETNFHLLNKLKEYKFPDKTKVYYKIKQNQTYEINYLNEIIMKRVF